MALERDEQGVVVVDGEPVDVPVVLVGEGHQTAVLRDERQAQPVGAVAASNEAAVGLRIGHELQGGVRDAFETLRTSVRQAAEKIQQS